MEKIKTLHELTKLVHGQLVGDPNVEIAELVSFEAAAPGKIVFLVDVKLADLLHDCPASAAIVPLAIDEAPLPIIRVANPYLAAALIQNHLLEQPFQAHGIHPRAYVGTDCQIPGQITIGPMAVLGDRVRLGKRVTIEPGVVIGNDVAIGDDCLLKANVTVADGTLIGRGVIIHSGTVIGSDGYGYATDARGFHVKRPQMGIVEIGDDVEIGANTCIDRATFGVTRIKSGSKIDNLVQIAHNVEVGENCLLVGQSGIAGSTVLGRNVVMGGQSAIAGHLHLADQVMVAGQAGVSHSQPQGARVGGMPAIDMRKFARISAASARLPDMVKEFREIRRRLAERDETE
ncbi:MAG: UDP-3-O-(3-hydroxymyristoyl)glucosamine N-acyltransferase [Desulfobulbaceae bacterium]|uniref:UDP-3-O-acylglucosamine N-acyltransferase n=1 Tax=Candidatus Desulfatifera sulfidica TaxID=2841691 RepID=A0A8J6TCV1_9BACT|nr:UDP-3-O-(3-hydroxymyristoyl)glucosamine N-acyltransferase [Candidatus Desulfatifera sulfidica]